MTRVLGGMSPIDPHWLRRMEGHGALDAVDVVAVHGFPLDWNLWPLSQWPDKIAEIKAVTDKPVWVTEVGSQDRSGPRKCRSSASSAPPNCCSSVPNAVFWYSLFDLPHERGGPRRATAKRRARLITAISIMG
jgi:hypothetical protein